ncbi:hypothetical protein TTHERM_00243810 (macronuclear) [Tetrahymena thermophila SB210]|uniref:Uncharacterized protein n=1 Tax=Tetrahymena thermophila (strain SB210) TaxID=312017 RepID=Q246B8_TETTS|nr:hypothetical protein TTHERM_00243810 [Tetrahymena thermophila SB210]EAS03465.2 hypothetical protein TTHERM_00243810 [Tetrahymena thermophila SB210]|eukprot:XP_001023710.2 hypothetical protein TTHERM_00243810 [Tetrahymena thermophila SB210]
MFESVEKKTFNSIGDKNTGQRNSRIQNNSDNRSSSKSGFLSKTSTSKVTFNMQSSEKQEIEKDFEMLKRFQKNPKIANYSKKNSIDPEILNSYDEKSISDYYGTLNHIKELQTPHIRTLNTNVQLDCLFSRVEEKSNIMSSPQKMVTPIKQIRLNTANSTSKSSAKLRQNTIQEWEQIQANNKLHNKKITPRKRFDNSSVEKLDTSQSNRNLSRQLSKATQQKIKESASQIVTLPGGNTNKILQDVVNILDQGDQSPNQKLYNNYLKMQDLNKQSSNKSKKNDSSNINSIMGSPKNCNDYEQQNQFSQKSNLFSKFFKSVNQSHKIESKQKQETYISMYKQDYMPKTKLVDIDLQSQQLKKQQRKLTNNLQISTAYNEPKENNIQFTNIVNKAKETENISQPQLSNYQLQQSPQLQGGSYQKNNQNFENKLQKIQQFKENNTFTLQNLEQSQQGNNIIIHA